MITSIILSVLSLCSKFLPAWINSWVQDKINKNKPEIVENKQAEAIQKEEDDYATVLARALKGDRKAQEEIRRREAE